MNKRSRLRYQECGDVWRKIKKYAYSGPQSTCAKEEGLNMKNIILVNINWKLQLAWGWNVSAQVITQKTF